MAVPRLEVLTTRQLAERLHDRFGAVARSRHDAVPRQRTLRAMFDWSWELLSVQERRLLQLLAASPAGTTLGSLELLAAADNLAEPLGGIDTLELLTALAQNPSSASITVPAAGDDAEPRYRLLETTRQYALDQLGPEQRRVLGRLHAIHLAALFEHAENEWPVTDSAQWLGRYGPEADNLRAALQWAFSRPEESELALRLTASSFSLWWELPGLPLRESRSWYSLAMAGIGPATRPRSRRGSGWAKAGRTRSTATSENFPAAFRGGPALPASQNPVGMGAALWRAASTVMFRDHEPSETALLDEAVRVLEGEPATKWQALCRVRQADLLQGHGALLPALDTYDEALAMILATGHSYGLMVCGGNRSYVLFKLGRHGEAIAALRTLHGQLPAGLRLPVVSLLAVMLASIGRDSEARAMALEGMTGTVSIGMIATVAAVDRGLGVGSRPVW